MQKKLLLGLLLMAFGIAMPAMADSYKLVTDASSLANGDQVILVGVNSNTYYAMSPTVTSSKIKSTAVTCADNTITLEASQTDVQILTLESQSDAPTSFALKQKGGDTYVIGTSTSSTNLIYGASPTYHQITINATTGAAAIYVNSTRLLRFYADANDFRAYTSKNGTDVYIYRLDSTGDDDNTLGDINVTYAGESVTQNNAYGFPLNAVLNVSSKNAQKIIYDLYDAELSQVDHEDITENGQIVLSREGTFSVMIFSYLDAEQTDGFDDTNSKSFTFTATVSSPQLGDIVGTYGTDNTSIAADNEISVDLGTEFCFSSEYASSIKVEAMDGDAYYYALLAENTKGGNVNWTADKTMDGWLVSVTSQLGKTSKTLNFYLTVTEPVIEPVNPDAEYVYTLVSNSSDIQAKQEYLIAASNTARVMAGQNTNNRASVAVEIINDEIWTLPEGAQVVKLLASEIKVGSYDIMVGTSDDGMPQYLYAAGNPSATKNENLLKTTTETSEFSAADITIADAVVKIDFSQATGKQGRYMHYNGIGTNTLFTCYTSEHTESGYEFMRLFKKIELPGMPVYDQYADDDKKVAIKIIKGQLHLIVTEYNSDGTEATGDDASFAPKKVSSEDNQAWSNPVTVDENGLYIISLPLTSGNYIKILAKNELNGYYSDELVKYVDSNGSVISGVEAVVADDDNAPVEYFNLQGVRVNADQPGLYIRRQGNKVEKVAIR